MGPTISLRTTRTHVLGCAIAAALVAALAAPAVGAAGAGQPGPGPFGPPGRGGPMMRGGPAGELMEGLGRLDLSDAQRDQVRGVLDRYRDDLRGSMEAIGAARKALHDAVTADSFDESAIRSASAALADLEADGAVLRARVHQEVWQVLTPEQREKAKALRADREERFQQFRARGEQRMKERRERDAR